MVIEEQSHAKKRQKYPKDMPIAGSTATIFPSEF
jgi:hypothetical protein